MLIFYVDAGHKIARFSPGGNDGAGVVAVVTAPAGPEETPWWQSYRRQHGGQANGGGWRELE